MPRIGPAPRAANSHKGRELARAARLLYGQNYLIPLARLLRVSTKTLRRWLDEGVPSLTWHPVIDAMNRRIGDLNAEVVKLTRLT